MIAFSGPGIHTGICTTIRIEPRTAGGIAFLAQDGHVPASSACLSGSGGRSTSLLSGDVRIGTVEHLLAALIYTSPHAVVHVNGPEIPILDGSALPFVKALQPASDSAVPPRLHCEEEMRVVRMDSVATLVPCAPDGEPQYTVVLDYDHPCMGDLTFTFRPFADDFAAQVAPARTFALEEEIQGLFRQGLAAGGGLHNALVIGREGPRNPGGMRFPDEPARHKMLDLLGDLALLGALPHAHLTIEKPGHGIHHALVRSIAASL